MAILEPGGQFTVVSLADGSVRFAVPLEAEPSLAWIQVIRSESQYLLLASQESGPVGGGGLTPLPITSSLQQRGMHGRVYAFYRTTGKLQWQTPAFVSHHWLPPDQPPESPLLFFIGQRPANNKTPTAILALDRRTGRNVYENELAGPTTITCEITADPLKQTVTLGLVSPGTRNVVFQFTDKPLPPQPPAQTGEMASSSAARRPASDNSLGAAIELLRRRLIPGQPAPADRPAARPAPRTAPSGRDKSATGGRRPTLLFIPATPHTRPHILPPSAPP